MNDLKQIPKIIEKMWSLLTVVADESNAAEVFLNFINGENDKEDAEFVEQNRRFFFGDVDITKQD